MPTQHDREFVEIALAKGYLETEQAREILLRLGLAERNRAQLSVDRLMIMEEILNPAQVREIQDAQRRRLVFCPCGQKTNIFDFEPGTRVKCRACGRILEIPEEDGPGGRRES